MSLSQADVQHIARLARLGLTPAEERLFAEQLSQILEYVGQLQQVDTTDVPPTAQVRGLTDVTRADVIESSPPDQRAALLAAVPEREGDWIKAKGVFEEEI